MALLPPIIEASFDALRMMNDDFTDGEDWKKKPLSHKEKRIRDLAQQNIINFLSGEHGYGVYTPDIKGNDDENDTPVLVKTP